MDSNHIKDEIDGKIQNGNKGIDNSSDSVDAKLLNTTPKPAFMFMYANADRNKILSKIIYGKEELELTENFISLHQCDLPDNH